MQHLDLIVLFALGVTVVATLVAGCLVVRRRRRYVEVVTDDHVDLWPDASTIWTAGQWPRIVVRSHGRLREADPTPRSLEVVRDAGPSWAPPQAF
jgi:hypothetical protein